MSKAVELRDTNRQISDADIDAAVPDVRDALRAGRQAGATLCSMLPGLLALQRMGVELDEGFRPSVPFVASAAAALVMAQVLRRLCWPETHFVHEFQIAELLALRATLVVPARHGRDQGGPQWVCIPAAMPELHG